MLITLYKFFDVRFVLEADHEKAIEPAETFHLARASVGLHFRPVRIANGTEEGRDGHLVCSFRLLQFIFIYQFLIGVCREALEELNQNGCEK